MKRGGVILLCLLLPHCCPEQRKPQAPAVIPDDALAVERYDDSTTAVYSIQKESSLLLRRWYFNGRPCRVDIVPFTSLNLPDSVREKLQTILPEYRRTNLKPYFDSAVTIPIH